MMYSDYMLMKLDADRRDGCLQRGAMERMLRSIRASKPGLKCKVCERLAALLLALGEKVQEQAQVKPLGELPAVGSEQLRRALDEHQAPGIFI